jgi:hypothetical protein
VAPVISRASKAPSVLIFIQPSGGSNQVALCAVGPSLTCTFVSVIRWKHASTA